MSRNESGPGSIYRGHEHGINEPKAKISFSNSIYALEFHKGFDCDLSAGWRCVYHCMRVSA